MIAAEFLAAIVGTGIIAAGTFHTYSHRTRLSEMCCMMTGMIFGTSVGFFTASLYALWTQHFIHASIIGSIVGIIAGLMVGNIGGPLSRMEGVMAGPMGGLMGAMFGQMSLYYNKPTVLIFIVGILLLTMYETRNMISLTVSKRR